MFTTELFEQTRRPVTICFGRMNPPTLGHKQLLDTVARAAGGNDYYIFASKTHKLPDNPLPYDVKYKFLQAMFPEYADHIVYDPTLKTIMQVAQWLYDKGYTELNFVAGSDRIPEFERLLNTYNGKGQPGDKGYYIFTKINYVSAGERDADAEGLAGISASKARAAAKAGNFEDFQAKTGAGKLAKPLYDAVREAMGVSEDIVPDGQVSTSPIHGSNIEEEAAGVGVVATNKKMAKDPRYSMSITQDIKPSTPKNMLRALRLAEGPVSDIAKVIAGMAGVGTALGIKQTQQRQQDKKEQEQRRQEREKKLNDPQAQQDFENWFKQHEQQRLEKLQAEPVNEKWSQKQRKSVNCNNPKGFSQKAHCAGRKARQAGRKTKSGPISESKQLELATIPMIKKFLPIVKKELEIDRLPKIKIQRHVEIHDGQATFGRFVNGEQTIYVGIADRHPVDVLRTLAHELVHWKQFLEGRIEPGSGETGSPIENEAHAVAGILMRHFNKKYPNAVKMDNIELHESQDYVTGQISYSQTLNPVAWEGDKLKPEVRDRLLKISGEFVKYLEVPGFEVLDVVLTGSMANFNWTKYSDFDLHVVTNYSDLECDDLAEVFYRAKKELWNNFHDITIGGHEVEMYVEDSAKPPVSAGIFSILANQWVKKPTYDKPEIDKSAINAKVRDLIQQIKTAIQSFDSPDDIQRIKDKLRKMRRAGLDTAGEFSVENLTYKILRNMGILNKMSDIQTREQDRKLSIPESKKKIKFLRSGELRGSYTDSQLQALGFRRSDNGAWYIPYDQWEQLVRDRKIFESKQGIAEQAFNGIDVTMEVEGDEIFVRATADGKELGHVLFVTDGEYLMPQDLEVEERFRGQGIAQTMYDYVKSRGYKIRRSGQQTAAGQGFWAKHRPEQNVWEQNLAEGKMAELDMDLEDPEISDREFEKIYGMTRKEARELFSKTNMWDFPDFRDPDQPLHEQDVTEGADISNQISISFQVNQDSTIDVTAMLDGEEVGHVNFDDSEGELIPQDLYVKPKYRGQGIAAAMYNYTKSKGYTILRGEEQSDDAIKLWNKHRPGQDIWEQSVAEGLEEAVGGNYLYHATDAVGAQGILQSGSILAASGPQPATQAQTKMPTVSVTRDWRYASGASQTQSQIAGIGRDVVFVLDRNAVESNFKTLSTSQSTQVKGLAFNPYLKKDGEARSQNTDPMARANAKAKSKYAEPTAKAGGEFEEAVVVPKGALPLKGTMVGFWVNPKSKLISDPTIMNDPRRLDIVRPNQFVKQDVAEGKLNETTIFLNPNTVIVGQVHGKPLELSPEISKRVQAIAKKHGAWYEGNGMDRKFTKGIINDYQGSWDDDLLSPSIKGYPYPFLYVLFSNIKANDTVKGKIGSDPKVTIFDRILNTQPSTNYFPDRTFSSEDLTKFLKSVSQEPYDFVKMSQAPATEKNVQKFFKIGEKLMWPENWEEYPNKAGQLAKRVNDLRDKFLASRKSGVYVVGSSHLIAVRNLVNKQGLAESLDESLDSPYSYHWEEGDFGDLNAYAKLSDNTVLDIEFEQTNVDKSQWNIGFQRDGQIHKTGKGDEQRVFATVLSAIKEFIENKQPKEVFFSAEKSKVNPESRKRLYDRLVQKYAAALGYQASQSETSRETKYKLSRIREQGVAEGKVINTYLWHGSRQKIPMLEPRQAVDTGGAVGSNQNAIYATSDPIFAIQMGMPAAGSDYGHFPNDSQMVLFSGKIRKGEYVYLHKLPFNGPDGKPQFVQGGNSREFHSIPGVQGIKPIEIKEIPVNRYLSLIRKATPADWKLRKKYMKKAVKEVVNPDIFDKNISKEPTQNVPMGDFEFKARIFRGRILGHGNPNDEGVYITAYDPKRPGRNVIGHAQFVVKSDEKGDQWLESAWTEVDEDYDGRGVAAMMYAFAKSLGNDIRPSPDQSSFGKRMWKKWGKDAKHLVGEQGVAENNLTEFAPSPDYRDDDDRQAMSLLEFAEIIKLFLGSEYTMIDRKTPEQVSVKFYPKDRTSGHNGAILYSVIRKQNEYPTVNFQLIDYEQGPQVGRGRRAGTAIPKTRTNALKIADIIYNTMGLPKQDRRVEENFADGRNPGRKGLAKRMGVPTKASVSRLRQIAKSSSGEKQRMAHWMANMKAGKKK